VLRQTRVSSTITKALVNTMDNTESRYLIIRKTGSLILSDFPSKNFISNLQILGWKFPGARESAGYSTGPVTPF
jgi:hypothetical protein